MQRDIDSAEIKLRDHRFGRINRRMPIGPVKWPFHDLFWIHEGSASIEFPELSVRLALTAPSGVLILPNTLFQGATVGTLATASICHFTLAQPIPTPGFLLPNVGEELHIQSLLKLSLHLAREGRDEDIPRRKRLLLTLLDGFAARAAAPPNRDGGRLAEAWRQATENLHRMRTLADVAALLGLSESTFRALHRAAWKTSAGEHLRELRLTRAEELLAGTDKSVAQIAAAVGYGHAATLSAAFRTRRGKTPGQYRHWSNPFT